MQKSAYLGNVLIWAMNHITNKEEGCTISSIFAMREIIAYG